MKKSTELKQERAAKMAEQRALVETAQNENRDMTADETATFDSLQGEIEGLATSIMRAEQFEANERTLRGGAPVIVGASDSEEREAAKLRSRFSLHKAIRAASGQEKLDGVEFELHQQTKTMAERSGVAIGGVAIPMPGVREKRADGQTVTGDSGGYGGNLVQTDVQDPIEYLWSRPMLVKAGARFLPGLVGNLKFPTNDGGITAAWEGEVDAVSNTKTAYGSKEMTPKRLAVSVPVSLQNLIQTNGAIERLTYEDIRMSIDNKIDIAAINGSGSSGQPLGILNTSGIGSVVGGLNGLAPTWAHVVGLESSVFTNNADVQGMGYIVNAATRGKLKTTTKDSNMPIYLMNEDGTMNGYPVWVTNNMPSNLTKGTSSGVCSAAIFGNFRDLIIGQWAFLDLSVDNLSRKKEGYIEITANTFVDLLVRHNKSFAAVKDWLTT